MLQIWQECILCNFKSVPFQFADLKITPEILGNSWSDCKCSDFWWRPFEVSLFPAFKCQFFWSFDLLEFLGLLTLQWFYRLFEYDLLYIFENLKCFSSVNLQLIRVWCKMKPLNLCKQGSSHYIIQHANEFCISKSPPLRIHAAFFTANKKRKRG